MKTKLIFGIVVGFIVLLIIALFAIIVRDVPNNRLNLYLTIEDSQILGFNSDYNPGAVYFGTMPPNAINAFRNVTITNDFENDRKVELVTIGDLESWISYSENGFILKPKEVKDVTLTATIPENPKIGNYTGELLVYLRKV